MSASMVVERAFCVVRTLTNTTNGKVSVCRDPSGQLVVLKSVVIAALTDQDVAKVRPLRNDA